MSDIDHLRRYGLFDARVPRFTSYPPATRFDESVDPTLYTKWLGEIPEAARISLYVHIPFCRRLCWFCACRTQGTRTNRPLARYVDAILHEARLVRERMAGHVIVARLHLGGGTPTILPPDLMAKLLGGLSEIFDLSDMDEFSVEIDPTEIDDPRLAMLFDHGLSRVSLGVQDFAPKVQAAIGRPQGFEETRKTFEALREGGIESINIDLLYGLPHQTHASLWSTLAQVIELSPDRLALYGYAHVPWVSKRQVMIPTDTLPSPETRLRLFDFAASLLSTAGYSAIGIDHFARPGDPLDTAMRERRLARSFQGYADDRTPYLIGLGASSISHLPNGFAQNKPSTGAYLERLRDDALPISRGIALSERDRLLSAMIESLMCYHDIRLADFGEMGTEAQSLINRLAHDFPDCVVKNADGVRIKEDSHALTRIIAASLATGEHEAERFSMAI